MKSVRVSTSPDRWSILESRPLRRATSGSQLLAGNGRFRSLARFALGGDGKIHVRSEIPPVVERDALRDDAESEMTEARAIAGENPAVAITELSTGTFEQALAAARECGWQPKLESGGNTLIPFRGGRGARFGQVDGNESIYTEALPQLPEDTTCQDAVIAYALTVSNTVRLARTVITEDRRLIWQVPMTGGFHPDLLEHALNALATAQRVSGSELEALAASISLASTWMHQQTQ